MINLPPQTSLLHDARSIIASARHSAVRSVEFHRVEMYWKLGERIFVEEQQEQERAEYGSYLIITLAVELEREFGSGFSKRQLERARQFYRLFPIASALRSQLNWFQYRLLIAIPDADKREYYELEAVKNHWSGKELERQINAQLYERLLLSNDKASVLAVARGERLPEAPTEIIKDPMILEFLGLERQPRYYEQELESALITHLQAFLLELGNGFTFVARQKRLLSARVQGQTQHSTRPPARRRSERRCHQGREDEGAERDREAEKDYRRTRCLGTRRDVSLGCRANSHRSR